MPITCRLVLISDPVSDECVKLLRSYGISVTTKYKLSKEELIKELQNHDSLIVRSETKVTSEVFDRCPSLRVVFRAGTGVDNIDLEAATRKGVLVVNSPSGNSISACELTCALISALARNVVQAAQSLKEGRWDRKLYSGYELFGKTLAVLGMGRIGREVARRMQAFGMTVIAFDPVLTHELANQLDIQKLSLDEIWPIADYITVHTPLIPQTKNLINSTTLAKCKAGVRVVNVARGGIVDEEALLNALKSGQCGGAALDVFIEEPPKNPVTLELIAHPKVIATPHLGASTAEAQTRVAVEIAQQCLVLAGKTKKYALTGIVNAPLVGAMVSDESKPWIGLAQKLGELAGQFIKGKLNVDIQCETVGNASMKEKTFLHTAILCGILAQTENDVNPISVSALAREKGIDVKGNHVFADEEAVVVQIEGHRIKGTIRNNEPLLLSVDDTVFSNGITLNNYISLYETHNVHDMVQIMTTFFTKGIKIRNLNANGNWMVVQTDGDVCAQVNGIEAS
ncbi:D-3-phosphoglycerate dehydrogenase [Anthophora plagiata]